MLLSFLRAFNEDERERGQRAAGRYAAGRVSRTRDARHYTFFDAAPYARFQLTPNIPFLEIFFRYHFRLLPPPLSIYFSAAFSRRLTFSSPSLAFRRIAQRYLREMTI